MGYYTRYKLETSPESALEKVMESVTEEVRYALGYDGSSGNSTKWHDHEEEMAGISERFPDVTFKLHGEGEQSADIWVKYFRNGKSQTCKAEIVIPPMREDAWK